MTSGWLRLLTKTIREPMFSFSFPRFYWRFLYFSPQGAEREEESDAQGGENHEETRGLVAGGQGRLLRGARRGNREFGFQIT